MMAATERDGELIADLKAQGPRLRKLQMMRIRRLGPQMRHGCAATNFRCALPALCSEGHGRPPALDPPVDQRSTETVSPPITQRSSAGVSLRVAGEVAVKLGEQCDAIGKPQLRSGGDECRILRGRCAIHDEARARQRLEHRHKRRVRDPVVRPSQTAAQDQRRV